MTTEMTLEEQVKRSRKTASAPPLQPESASTGVAIPLCVDMDGTLIRTDLLHEAVFAFLRGNLARIFLLAAWLMKGKAHLKAQLAVRVQPDVAHLPYTQELLDLLHAEKAAGRSLILATASPKVWADAVADHLGLFDDVVATTETENMAGANKAARLATLFGENGFDYAGNSKHDLAVWDKAHTAIVVRPDLKARAWAKRNGVPIIADGHVPATRLKTWAKAVRVHQWLKNTLLFVPGVLSFDLLDMDAIIALVTGFLAFSFCASSVYLLNDVIDIEADRKHPTKCKRPIPAGRVSIQHAMIGAALCLLVSASLTMSLPWQFGAVLALYAATTFAYSFLLKRVLLIDVFTLAGLFTIRVIAGSAVLLLPISTWLLAFCVFFFLSLALVKRFVELQSMKPTSTEKLAGRGYRAEDIETIGQAGMASAFAAVVVLALFIDSPEIAQNYANPHLIWLVLPPVLFVTFRIWILARRREMHEDPVVFIMTDWRSQIMIAAGAVVMLGSQWMVI